MYQLGGEIRARLFHNMSDILLQSETPSSKPTFRSWERSGRAVRHGGLDE